MKHWHIFTMDDYHCGPFPSLGAAADCLSKRLINASGIKRYPHDGIRAIVGYEIEERRREFYLVQEGDAALAGVFADRFAGAPVYRPDDWVDPASPEAIARKAWLDGLRAGDHVSLVTIRHGAKRTEKLDIVVHRTPSGRIVVRDGAKEFYPDGRLRGRWLNRYEIHPFKLGGTP